MSCSAQMMAPKEGVSNWNATFPSHQSTQEQSTLFMKKLLAVSVSEIMYLRAIFPEKAFGDRKVEDLELKILSEKSNVQGACQVIQWMKGCFQALEKKYLRQIQLAVYLDENNPDNAVESYVFRFSYFDNQTVVTCNSEELATTSTQPGSTLDIRKATLALLRTTVLLTRHLEPLPEPAFLGMKLLYYDDVTPADYEPEGFKSCSTPNYSFPKEPINVKLGEVNTKFHQIRVKVKTDKYQFDCEDEETLASSVPSGAEVGLSAENLCQLNKNDAPEHLKHANRVPNNSPAEDKMQCEESLPLSQHVNEKQGNMESDQKGPGYESDSSNASFHSKGGLVCCPCEDMEDDGLMIQCMSCACWQHGFCFAVMKSSDAPDSHYCHACADMKSVTRVPTDFFLQSLNEKSRKDLCLWRRTLQACFEEKTLSATQLCTKLSISKDYANSLLDKLQTEGFVTQGLGRFKKRKTVKKDLLKSVGIPRYLTRRSSLLDLESHSLGGGDSINTLNTFSISPKPFPNNDNATEMSSLVEDTQKLTMSHTNTETRKTRNNKRKQLQNLNLNFSSDSQEVCSSQSKDSMKRMKSSSSVIGIKV